jgi:hypothetical protein
MKLMSGWWGGVIEKAQPESVVGDPYLLLSYPMYYLRLKKEPVHPDFDVFALRHFFAS